MNPLNDKQIKAKDFIYSHIDSEGVAPTIRQLQKYMNYGAVSASWKMIETLIRKGWLQRIKYKHNLMKADHCIQCGRAYNEKN